MWRGCVKNWRTCGVRAAVGRCVWVGPRRDCAREGRSECKEIPRRQGTWGGYEVHDSGAGHARLPEHGGRVFGRCRRQHDRQQGASQGAGALNMGVSDRNDQLGQQPSVRVQPPAAVDGLEDAGESTANRR